LVPRTKSRDDKMFVGNTRLTAGKDLPRAPLLVVAGLAISVLSLTELEARDRTQLTQATPTPQTSPSVEKPAESKPGGTRPTTPAPEPAQPNPAAQKEGAKPALPPAPAEKVAPPIKEKEK
jgi:hypothetical protein